VKVSRRLFGVRYLSNYGVISSLGGVRKGNRKRRVCGLCGVNEGPRVMRNSRKGWKEVIKDHQERKENMISCV
jgi:hypothetical protein